MATVSLRDVTKSFGSTEVIKGVSADIQHGEFVALVGPSGCGKSTLLRMIAGLEDVSGGVIEIGGRKVNDVPPKARDVAMVFQNYALYPHMTVAENLGFSLRMQKRDKAEVARRVAEAAASRELSGGQRQRVATGRAIVRDPQVFLFDEPLSNLDAKLRVQVRAELRQLHRRLGVTSIYVTHDQVEAMTMADRIVVLRDGVVEQIGAPLELYDCPANTFVAAFIGSPAMNLIEGRCSQGAFILANGTAIPIRPDPGGVPEPATLGVRPDHFEIVAVGAGDAEACVVAFEPTGAETMVMAELSGQQITIVTRERFCSAPGSLIGLRAGPAHHHYFDAQGLRIPVP